MAREGILAHPVFGVGLGNFQLYFESRRGTALADHNGVYDDVHNLWLQQAVSGGLGFALSFLFLLVYACQILYERFKIYAELKDVALLASLVAWVVSASFNPVALPNFLLLAVLLANIFSYRLKDLLAETYTPAVNPRKLTKVYYLVSGLLIIFACGLLLGEVSFFNGLQAFNQQKYTDAKKWFQVAKIIHPINRLSQSYFVATQIILNPSGQYEQAIQQTGRWERKDANTLATQAKLFYLWFAVDKNNQTHLDQAILKLQESVAVDSYYPQRYFRLGFYLAERGKLAEARETVKYGLTLYNKDVAGWVLLARIYQLENKSESTVFAINKAYRLEPMLPELRFLQRFLKAQPLNFQQYPIPAQIDSLDFR
jgi:tetratricopeptide (TPR) repeat protein